LSPPSLSTATDTATATAVSTAAKGIANTPYTNAAEKDFNAKVSPSASVSSPSVSSPSSTTLSHSSSTEDENYPPPPSPIAGRCDIVFPNQSKDNNKATENVSHY
jgi:hypothetical protein